MLTMTSEENAIYNRMLESVAESYCKWWKDYTDLCNGNYADEDLQMQLTRDSSREWEAKRSLVVDTFKDCLVTSTCVFEHMEPIAKRMLKETGVAY